MSTTSIRTPQADRYIYVYGGALGETIFGIHLARTLAANVPGARLTFLSTRENPIARALVMPLPFASYVECPKERLPSWIYLLRLAREPHCIVVHQPLSGPMPLWWKCLLRAATIRVGSVEVRCAPSTTAHLVPVRARRVVYDPAKDQLFGSIPHILAAWGVHAVVRPPVYVEPSLYTPREVPRTSTIVFHFFAPSGKRSMPVQKASEIVRAAAAAFPDLSIVLTTDKRHADVAYEIADDLPADIRVDLPLPRLIETLVGARVYVGVDTGITHLACALQCPSVVLGNWSNPCWLPAYAPLAHILVERKNCICNGDKTGECYYEIEGARRYRCMVDIETPLIIRTIAQILRESSYA